MREAVVSGRFYDADVDGLKKNIEECFIDSLGPGSIPKVSSGGKIYGGIVPHAGFVYSGPSAANAYFKIFESSFPDTFIILCPNHTGLGSFISLSSEKLWETPLGSVEVDSELNELIYKNSTNATMDDMAHIKEHSCEVQLPFIQYFSSDFKIVPIVLAISDLEVIEDFADSIVKSIKESGRDVAIIATTDLNHYESHEETIKKDEIVLEDIKKMDEESLISNVLENNISMCGYGPTALAISLVKKLGAKECEILSHYTSGNISGDFNSVVGYTSAIFK